MIRLHAEEKKQNQALRLRLEIDRKPNHSPAIRIGFEARPLESRELLVFADSEKEILFEGKVSFEEKENRFYFFPYVDLVWKETPRAEIHSLVANRRFTNPGKEWSAVEKSQCPRFLAELFSVEAVLSLYARDKVLQIETRKGFILSSDTERQISDLVLDYFMDLLPPLDEQSQNHQ